MQEQNKKSEDKSNGIITKVFSSISNKIQYAIDEVEIEEAQRVQLQLKSIKRGIFYFELLESDIQNIHRLFQLKGDRILGNYLIITRQSNDFILEIETYLQQGEKTLINLVRGNINDFRNIPTDIRDELKEKDKVRIHLEV